MERRNETDVLSDRDDVPASGDPLIEGFAGQRMAKVSGQGINLARCAPRQVGLHVDDDSAG